MIFQEPMAALDPVYTIGEQIAETIVQHEGIGRADGDEACARTAGACEDPVGGAAAEELSRTKCRAACGSGR